MATHETMEHEKPAVEKPDAFWYRVYIAVVVNTVIVITLLWGFSHYFSI